MIILVYSFSLFVSSKTRYHAEFKYIESSLFWGANRVHYGGYASGVYVPTSSALDECLLVHNFHNNCSKERH